MRRREAGSEGELRGGAVDPGHVRIGHERRSSLARNERAEQLERARSHLNAARCEHDTIEIGCAGVGHLLVERAAPFVERAEIRLLLRQRPLASRRTFPRSFRIDLEQDGDGTLAQLVADRGRLDCASAERDHRRLRKPQRSERLPRFPEAELGLSFLPEELGDGLPQRPLELPIQVDERTTEALGDLGPERRLPRAHEADEREVGA